LGDSNRSTPVKRPRRSLVRVDAGTGCTVECGGGLEGANRDVCDWKANPPCSVVKNPSDF
jgi:hypothetical protein